MGVRESRWWNRWKDGVAKGNYIIEVKMKWMRSQCAILVIYIYILWKWHEIGENFKSDIIILLVKKDKRIFSYTLDKSNINNVNSHI